MDVVGRLKKFMKFIRDKYKANDAFRAHGEYPWPLIEESGIDFGDGEAQLAAMDILLQQGLIEVVNRKSPKHITLYHKIRPSLKALEPAPGEQRRVWLDIVSAVAEGITRGIIKG
jgi:hypothetical protein